MFFAVWMAASPATPAPSTRTRAGASLPAAVIDPAIVLPYACAASITALKPAKFACDDNASKAWPRESKRGMQSIAKTVEPWSWSCCIKASFCGGWTMLNNVRSWILAASAGEGGAIFVTMSAAQASSSVTIEAPTFLYMSSEKPAAAPALLATLALKPALTSNASDSGVWATLFSVGSDSGTTPMVRSAYERAFPALVSGSLTTAPLRPRFLALGSGARACAATANRSGEKRIVLAVFVSVFRLLACSWGLSGALHSLRAPMLAAEPRTKRYLPRASA
mmetsp:Transcript_23441/g.65731  ORF Transcript_23441/g.65731 Transcript_23441/m.65731 type:complete len:279 (+) Transcript_23441:133-969(+)